MKSILIILLITMLTLSQLSSSANAKRSHQKSQTFEENEFSEFDTIGDDNEEAVKRSRKPLDEAKIIKESKASDFSGFDNEDETVENADDEDFEDPNDDDDFKKNNFDQKPKPDDSKLKVETPKQAKSSFGSFNNQDDLDMEEFEHFVDDEEFEGFESTTQKSESSKESASSKKKQPNKQADNNGNKMPNLKIADVPMHLISRGNWSNYVWEMVLLVLIAIYFINYIYGKNKNYKLVTVWYQSHRELLERNFSVVGDDGTTVDLPGQNKENEEAIIESGTLIKESENSYGLWCTGRQMCDGMLVQLKLIKRQDLINGVLMQFIKPQSDQIIISVEYPTPDDIDNFVFCLSNKKLTQQLFNDYQDISSYCTEKKTLPSSGSGSNSDYKYADLINPSVASKYTMLNESIEVPNAILDMRVCAFLNKYPEMVEYLLVSDQYVGFKAQTADEQSSATPTDSATVDQNASSSIMGLPKSRCILILCLNIPGRGLNTTNEDMEKMQPAFQLAMYLIDKVPRIRLSKEAKAKAIKKRKELSEQVMKLTHKQRQEAAMLRKEEKRRAEKEKIMNESDPEKQKRLEENQIKREKRKNLSKMKQVKIKSM